MDLLRVAGAAGERVNPWHLGALCGQEKPLLTFDVGLQSSSSGQRLLALERTCASRSDPHETGWMDGWTEDRVFPLERGWWCLPDHKSGCVCLRHHPLGLNFIQIFKHELNSQNEASECAYTLVLAGGILQNNSSSSITNPSNCIFLFQHTFWHVQVKSGRKLVLALPAVALSVARMKGGSCPLLDVECPKSYVWNSCYRPTAKEHASFSCQEGYLCFLIIHCVSKEYGQDKNPTLFFFFFLLALQMMVCKMKIMQKS